MNALGLGGLLNFLACSGLALLVLNKSSAKKYKTAVAYAIFNLSVGFYNLFYFVWQGASNSQSALLWFHLLFLGVIWINQAYLFFIFTFLEITPVKKQILYACFFLNTVFSLLNFCGWMYPVLEPRFGLGYWPKPTWIFVVYLIFWHFECLYGFMELLKSFRQAHGMHREQLKYLAVAFGIGYIGGATNWPLWFGVYFPPYFNGLIAVYDAVIAYAILRHQLMNINLIIRKTIIYSVVTGTLTVIYLGIVALFAHLFEGLTGYQTIFSSAVAAGLITVCFQPLRKKVQSFVDGKFFRQYVDREEKLYELSREVITHTTPEAMAQSLIRVLGDTLHPKSVALYLRSRDGSGFVLVSKREKGNFPDVMTESNPLTNYFMDHPQPFIQDLPSEIGETVDTRRPARQEDAAT